MRVGGEAAQRSQVKTLVLLRRHDDAALVLGEDFRVLTDQTFRLDGRQPFHEGRVARNVDINSRWYRNCLRCNWSFWLQEALQPLHCYSLLQYGQ